MEKQKRWQLFLILAVIFLTTYNILPTVLYYLQPLDKPINSSQATKTVHQIVNRTTALEKESVLWLESFSKLLSIKPASITLDKEDPQLIQVAFKTTKEADTFRSYLPRAGALIPFVPSQLSLTEVGQEETSKTVTVSRKVGTYFTPEQANDYFTFSEKFDAEGKLTPFYRKVLNDRLTQLSFSIGGASENAQLLSSALHATDPSRKEEFLMALCHNLKEFVEVFGESSSLAKRAFASVTQGDFQNKSSAIDTLIADLETFKDRVRLEKIQVQEKESHLKKENSFLTTEDQQRLEFLIKKEELLASTVTLLKNHTQNFAAGLAPWSYQTLPDVLAHSSERDNTQTIKIGPHHPFINALVVDFDKQSAALTLHSDVVKLQTAWSQSREKASMKDRLEQLLFNEIARIARESNETIQPSQNQFEIALSSITDSQSFLAFDLTKVASDESVQLKKFLEEYWHPKHPDLRREVYPIWDYATYQNLPVHARQLGLVVCTPSMQDSSIPQGMKTNSIYVIAKGMDEVFKNAEKNANAPEADLFMQDFQNLQKLLRNKGYYGYPGTTYPLSASFAKDFIFESENLYSTLLTAFRENFHVFGTKKYAVLEFSNTKQRIYALNQIENSQQEDLLKWRDDYQAARVNPNVEVRFDVPKPVYSPLWRNFVLSFKKYFRGDERKVLHWGLDLSGGKTVQIELRDQNGHKVTNPADLAQGVNELYNRVNKMGLSEVSIREHGSNIILDFPGAQGLSATELVKASSMYFHVVNETFTPNNAELAQAVNRFLQDIWNEAVVTNKKDIDSVNRIAWKHLYGESLNPEQVQPRSDAAKLLYDHGLRFPLEEETVSSNFGETYSKIALLRGDNFTEWFNQSHPLLIVFNNYALEGANLTNVHSSYDPSKGNFLAFDVKGSYTARDGQKMNPRTDLFAWTSAFSKEKIVNTASEKVSRGKGWRMAVILNGSVISAPTLDSALKDSAMISGSFTQREINKLEADLKAGSLTFSPVILSEQNVSPELGAQERSQGIFATILALILVVTAIVGYYRFAGMIASIALLFNLFIMWAIFQNIQATLTLAGIAGVILTMGMAVDANVLVFERIKEELKASGRLASAIHAGYKRAFTAILDSNVTTVIAALILLHFDAGPIKGFAITLIIGIVSSMFTALFMTRFFFAGWVQNPQHKTLTMSSWIPATNFNFLKFGKAGIVTSLVIVVMAAVSGMATKNSILGLDFTGGFSLSIELKPLQKGDYRTSVEKALAAKGLSSQDFQVRELSPSNHLRVFLSKTLEKPHKPFHGLPPATVQEVGFAYENNPRIVWILDALKAADLVPTSASEAHLDEAWTNISGQFSESMRNNALYGLTLALLCILLYITVRFEFKYAVAATLGLLHDVIITLGTLCILHACGVPVQIELNTIAALMAIIGYSLNDTIIIFDRIREDLKLLRKLPFRDVMNRALNVTLSRTLMTSGTTVLVLLALVSVGGSSLFGFSLVMTIGIVYGTLSSLFVATPLLYYLQKREVEKQALEDQVSH